MSWHMYALLQGRIRLRWGFCSKPSHSHSHIPRETGGDQTHSVFMGRLMPGNLSRACQAKRSHIRGEVIPPVPILLGGNMPSQMHASWLMFMIVDHSIFIFTMIKFWSSCPYFLYLYPKQFVCGLYGHIWFCEPLHLYVTSYLILWTVKFLL